MPASVSSQSPVTVDGKFFRLGDAKFYPKGVTYGPFAPDDDGTHFATREQTAKDFAHIRELNANVVRIYHVPPRWFLDLAAEHGLKLFIDIPWNKHLCFLDSAARRKEACEFVRNAVFNCARHPAVFAFSVANEIAPDIVRWSGAEAVAEFIDELAAAAKDVDPDCLCTFANYPPTEFLRPQNLDFACFNVYLHNRQPFENYMARLQTLAESKPLVLGEFGMDSLRESEETKCETLAWQIESAFRCGLAGAVIFSFTDDWFKDGRQIEDWTMGLTTRDRRPKASFETVKEMFSTAPYFPLSRYPKVSVVIASYNGDRTLKACLDSLESLNYPDYEVVLVDDGSTDTTKQIAALHRSVKYIRHETNAGLSIARNTGIEAAKGEIVAFTDSDCRADRDWLYYLVGDLLNSDFIGIGGHNLLPPEDSPVAAAVMVSPGGPAHVMLTDKKAEHIPGCNMAFYKSALEAIGNFDPVFTKAGDDVDICWRLQHAGYKIGFSAAGFVWHYRRSTIRAYLRQQDGYGEAEAMLVSKHPEYFNLFGGSIWRGKIYTESKFGLSLRPPIIYHGPFGSGWFQTLYKADPAYPLMLCVTPEFHLLVTLPLWILAINFWYLLPLAIVSLLFSVGICVTAAIQSHIPKNRARVWSRPLIALLYLLQPVVRGWARYRGRLVFRRKPHAAVPTLSSLSLQRGEDSVAEVHYWSNQRINRLEFVKKIVECLERDGWPNKTDIGWSQFDVEIYGDRWSRLQLTTVSEDLIGDRQLIRCRLRAIWSEQAKVVFWATLAVQLLLIGIFTQWRPWTWLLLLTMPPIAWFLRSEERNLESLIATLLDKVAEESGMTKAQPQASEKISAAPPQKNLATPANAIKQEQSKSPRGNHDSISPTAPTGVGRR